MTMATPKSPKTVSTNDERLSPLYSRHNGAMLGFFLFLNRFRFARTGFQVRRKRMQQFLAEIGSSIVLPESQPLYTANFAKTLDELMRLFESDPSFRELFTAFILAFGFTAHAVGSPADLDIPLLETMLGDLNIGPAVLHENLTLVTRGKNSTKIDAIMSPALQFLKALVQPLQVEENTCFVAMPFRAPFDDRFELLYRPLLERNGYRCFRAWGGLSYEFHLDLLTTLIDKSGAFLAELALWNPNVMFEVGYAYGRDKIVFQVADQTKFKNPANLNNTATIPYDPAAPGWPESFISGLGGRWIRAVEEVAKEGLTPPPGRGLITIAPLD